MTTLWPFRASMATAASAAISGFRARLLQREDFGLPLSAIFLKLSEGTPEGTPNPMTLQSPYMALLHSRYSQAAPLKPPGRSLIKGFSQSRVPINTLGAAELGLHYGGKDLWFGPSFHRPGSYGLDPLVWGPSHMGRHRRAEGAAAHYHDLLGIPIATGTILHGVPKVRSERTPCRDFIRL